MLEFLTVQLEKQLNKYGLIGKKKTSFLWKNMVSYGLYMTDLPDNDRVSFSLTQIKSRLKAHLQAFTYLKGLVHPKMKIKSLITH